MGDAPYNAGQTFQIANVVVGPVSTLDFGTITVTENWGRLFIEQSGATIMVLSSVYPDLRNVIDHFIEPTPDAVREADLRAEVERLTGERDAALARERALLDSNEGNRQARLNANAIHQRQADSLRADRDRLRALLDEAREAFRKLDVGEGWAAQVARAALAKIGGL